MNNNILELCLPNFGTDLIADLKKFGTIKEFSGNDFVIKQGQYVRSLPIVLNGNIKVYSQEEELQFLLYYISQGQACIFSFAHLFDNKPIEFSAISEGSSALLLIPIDKAKEWLVKYPAFNTLIINEFQKHYNDLLQTTKQIICYKIEDRLLEYLKRKSELRNTMKLSISHREIAEDLGTSREVVSRLLKKLENDKVVMQEMRSIIIL
jgi:CRP/FNR family transcriptional regulator, anaerobic regulatory protein